MAPYRKYDPMAMVDTEKAKRQARLNKKRADRMERDVAAYLTRGRLQVAKRTPQSGAGWIKGDNHVPLSTPPYFFLISCKMSQAQTEDNRAYIKFSTAWVDELRRDVQAMKSIGCKFGIIVLRWFGRAKGELIALVDVKDFQIIKDVLDLDIKTNDTVLDRAAKKNGSPLKLSILYRDYIISNINSVIKVSNAEFVVLHLSTIHEALINLDAKLKESEVF